MFRRVCISLGLGVVVVAAGFAQSSDDARALVAKAIRVMGGEKNLAKHKSATWIEKGTYYGMGDGLEYTGTYAAHYPDQFRMEIKDVFTIVVNREKGWLRSPEGTMEMTKDQLANQQQDLRAGWITSLVPLKNPAFKLAKVDDATVDGQPTAGVLVTRQGYPDVKLYFDKKTGFRIKSEYRTKAAEQGMKVVTQDLVFSDFRDVAGAKVPHKVLMTRDGKKFVEAEVSDMQLKKLDDSVFTRP